MIRLSSPFARLIAAVTCLSDLLRAYSIAPMVEMATFPSFRHACSLEYQALACRCEITALKAEFKLPPSNCIQWRFEEHLSPSVGSVSLDLESDDD